MVQALAWVHFGVCVPTEQVSQDISVNMSTDDTSIIKKY